MEAEMKKEEFIGSIKKYVRDSAVKGSFEIIVKPPGKAPNQELVGISTWYNSLSAEDKEMTKKVAQMTLDQGIHNFLCVLDGVTVLDDQYKGGSFALSFRSEGKEITINDKRDDFEELHDIYNWEIER